MEYGLARYSVVYGVAWPGNAWHGIRYGIVGKAWYMVRPDGHHMVYGMALWIWRGIRHGLAGIPWYMLWAVAHGMVYGMA